MINAVAIQRLLEAAILLKLERGTRTDGGQTDVANRTGKSELTSQHLTRGTIEAAMPNRRPSQSGAWNMLATLPPDSAISVAAPIAAQVTREATLAPLAYRESLAEAATPSARLAEQPLAALVIVPAPIQYAHAELARALAANGQRAPIAIASQNASGAGASMAHIASAAEQAIQRRKVMTRALIVVSLILAAAYTIAAVA